MSDKIIVEESTPIVASPLTVEERLAYLEEQNEGLKRVGKLLLGLCLLTAGLLVWTQSNMRGALHSESLILGTSQAPRATLTTTPNGHLGFLFYDHLGILPPSPQFGAIPYLDGFAIYDREGRPRIVIGVNDKDQAILDILSTDGKLIFSAAPPDGANAPKASGAPGAAPTGAPGAATTGAPSAAPNGAPGAAPNDGATGAATPAVSTATP